MEGMRDGTNLWWKHDVCACFLSNFNLKLQQNHLRQSNHTKKLSLVVEPHNMLFSHSFHAISHLLRTELFVKKVSLLYRELYVRF